jgi:hypothetical protein
VPPGGSAEVGVGGTPCDGVVGPANDPVPVVSDSVRYGRPMDDGIRDGRESRREPLAMGGRPLLEAGAAAPAAPLELTGAGLEWPAPGGPVTTTVRGPDPPDPCDDGACGVSDDDALEAGSRTAAPGSGSRAAPPIPVSAGATVAGACVRMIGGERLDFDLRSRSRSRSRARSRARIDATPSPPPPTPTPPGRSPLLLRSEPVPSAVLLVPAISDEALPAAAPAAPFRR